MTQKIIGSYIVHLEQVDSTNNYAMNYIKGHPVPEGYLIVTGNQYEGKGLGANRWESEPDKNLTFSVVLYPRFLAIGKQFMLNKMVSLALHDFADALLEKASVRIKWPNDLYIGDRKAAGVLINNSILGSSIVHSVIGIGVNINQVIFTSNAPNPVSLRNITGKEYDLDRCLTELTQKLDSWYEALRSGSFRQMDEAYLSRLYRLGRYYPYFYKNDLIEACIETVDNTGHLVLLKRDGTMLKADQKDIEFIIDVSGKDPTGSKEQ